MTRRAIACPTKAGHFPVKRMIIMTCTREELAERSRRNGSRSLGPKTEQGKSVSRRNSLNHGMRAQTLALMPMPNEDPLAIAALARRWQDHYQPQSPAAEHLLELCVRSKIVSDRTF